MSYLPYIESNMQSTIEWLTTENHSSDPIACMAGLQQGFNMSTTTDWWEDSDSIIDTLIALLFNRDRRIVLLAVIYLGLLQDIRGQDEERIEGVKRAIDPINDLAKRNNDKNLAIAFGITNAVLGDPSAAKWMAQQMEAINKSSEDDFKKLNRLILVQQIAKGWS